MFVRPINLPTKNPNEMPSSLPDQKQSNYIMMKSLSKVTHPKLDLLEKIQLTDSKLVSTSDLYDQKPSKKTSNIGQKWRSLKSGKILNRQIEGNYEKKQTGKALMLFHHENLIVFRFKIYLGAALSRAPGVALFFLLHYLIDIPASEREIGRIVSLGILSISIIVRFCVCRFARVKTPVTVFMYTLLRLLSSGAFDFFLCCFRFDLNNQVLLSSLPLVIFFSVLVISFIAILFEFIACQIVFIQLAYVLICITGLVILSSWNKWEPLIFALFGTMVPITWANFTVFSLHVKSYDYFSSIGLMELWFRTEQAICTGQFKRKYRTVQSSSLPRPAEYEAKEFGEPEDLLSTGRRC